MKSYIQNYILIIKTLKRDYKKFFKYQLMTKIIMFVLLMPLFNWFFNRMLQSRGYEYLANNLVLDFLTSPQGIFFGVVTIIMAVSVALVEIGGVIVISHHSLISAEEKSFFQVAKYSMSKLKYFIGLDGILVAIYLFIMTPLLGGVLNTSLIGDIKIPGFIMDVINNNQLYTALLNIMFTIFFVLIVLWSFSLHIILLSETREKKFLKKSRQLVMANLWTIIKDFLMIILFTIVLAFVGIILFLVISFIIGLIFASISETLTVSIIFSVGIVLLFLLSMIALPFSMMHMTILYHEIGDTDKDVIIIKGDKKKHFIDKLLNMKLVVLLCIILGMVFYSFAFYVVFDQEMFVNNEVEITAHRGSSLYAPENTLAAINAASSNGADYAEIDVQETKDNKTILLHDGTFERTTGDDRKPSEMTLEEIKQLDAGSWFSDDFEGEKVPTLEEIMDAANNKIKLNIEIKSAPTDQYLIENVVKLIQEKKYYDKCVVTSLNYETLQQVRKLDPKIKIGYVMFVALGDLEALDVDFYSVEETNVDEGFVEDAHAIGREVHVWTINTEESMINMLQVGVDNIITDRELLLKEVIRENKDLSEDIKRQSKDILEIK